MREGFERGGSPKNSRIIRSAELKKKPTVGRKDAKNANGGRRGVTRAKKQRK